MDTGDSEFLKRIQSTFRLEADDHLKNLSTGLIEMEKAKTDETLAGIIEKLFREVHSLKGAARSVGSKEIESVCQPLEALFSALKKQEISMSPLLLDILYKTMDIFNQLVLLPNEKPSFPLRLKLKEHIMQLNKMCVGKGKAVNDGDVTPGRDQPSVAAAREESPEVEPEHSTGVKQSISEMVKIPVTKLDPLLFQAEEFLQSKLSIQQQANDLIAMYREVTKWKSESQKWKNRRLTLTPYQWIEWLQGNEMRLNKLETQLATVTNQVERTRYGFERMVNDHLDAIKQVLMLPVSMLVESFPVMVRGIACDQQKEIELTIHGSELEIDKRILEELKDPLIHLMRNCIDHGIGKPAERLALNKSSQGKIKLTFIARESGLFEIIISDDGKGIDAEQVLKAAVKSGSITEEIAPRLTPEQILHLIYQSGVSTSPIITDLSGRGLGLSIVREKVEKLNGRISIETKKDFGTTFRILLPMSLATFRGILVSLGEFRFIIPTMNVERIIRVRHEDIHTMENHKMIRTGDDILPCLNLSEVIGLSERRNGLSRLPVVTSPDSDFLRIVILIDGEHRMAFRVDEVLDEQQVLVKRLGKLLRRIRNISGATILGSGKIVPVLNISDIMKSALKQSEVVIHEGEETATVKQGRILVAEDSITSRTLLKNILETAGYTVTVAIDGADAFAKVRSGEFDMVVSDVDMPRMNGFELTVKIKNDKKLGEIPVVLVTALGSREDREKGIEAGADAYIVKSSFDQGNLLEVIKKLI